MINDQEHDSSLPEILNHTVGIRVHKPQLIWLWDGFTCLQIAGSYSIIIWWLGIITSLDDIFAAAGLIAQAAAVIAMQLQSTATLVIRQTVPLFLV